MIITKKALPRRTFLQAMGTTLALPLLDAMVPALSATQNTAANPVRRLGFVYMPMGNNPAKWTPPGDGKISELSPSLASLKPFLDHVTVLTNLQVKKGYALGGGDHATANSCFLSCAEAKRTEGNNYYLGTTVDQIVAQQLGQDTRLPSLELGTDLIAQAGGCDSGYSCAYQFCLSWSSPTTPLPAEADPRVAFERLFGEGGSAEAQRTELRRDRSLLDSVIEDIARLERRVGASDRTRLGQYLDSVREVERRIQRAERQTGQSGLVDLERPATLPESWEEHVKLMFDLQLLALQADITRVIVFQLAREASTRTYPQIGVPDGHHGVSHHNNNAERLDKLAKINGYHVSLFADFLARLQSTPDGVGSLFDHTMYFFGSGMGNPDIHNHDNIPAILAGGGAGKHKGGSHIKYRELTPLANLHLTLLDKMGIRLESFADSTGLIEPLSI
jgi:hypothetical protein